MKHVVRCVGCPYVAIGSAARLQVACKQPPFMVLFLSHKHHHERIPWFHAHLEITTLGKHDQTVLAFCSIQSEKLDLPIITPLYNTILIPVHLQDQGHCWHDF